MGRLLFLCLAISLPIASVSAAPPPPPLKPDFLKSEWDSDRLYDLWRGHVVVHRDAYRDAVIEKTISLAKSDSTHIVLHLSADTDEFTHTLLVSYDCADPVRSGCFYKALQVGNPDVELLEGISERFDITSARSETGHPEWPDLKPYLSAGATKVFEWAQDTVPVSETEDLECLNKMFGIINEMSPTFRFKNVGEGHEQPTCSHCGYFDLTLTNVGVEGTVYQAGLNVTGTLGLSSFAEKYIQPMRKALDTCEWEPVIDSTGFRN